jgi:biotin transporter BioY
MSSTTIVQLRTVPVGTSGPEGWQSFVGPESGYVTYYSLTPR